MLRPDDSAAVRIGESASATIELETGHTFGTIAASVGAPGLEARRARALAEGRRADPGAGLELIGTRGIHPGGLPWTAIITRGITV